MKTIALAGEAFSRNMGDQAIHSCLAYLLRQQDAGLEILSLDISGRSAVGPSARQWLISVFRAIPGSDRFQPLANLALNLLIRRRRQVLAWKPILAGSDGLVIGGGQLLMDNHLDFPLKVSSLAGLAGQQGLPTHFSGCGVGKTWSQTARKLFQPVLAHASSVSLRDELSRLRLADFMPSLQSRVTFDSAILAAEVYPVVGAGRHADRIGLGVIDCTDVNFHLPPGQRFSSRAWLELWLDLLSGLTGSGLGVELFTTGSPQDVRFARHLFKLAQERGWNRISLAPGPSGPAGLLETLRNYSLVIAARLHASTLANSLGISSLGLGWDEKVAAYYAETGLPERCFDLAGLPVAGLVGAARTLDRQPFPAALLADLKDRARENARIILGR